LQFASLAHPKTIGIDQPYCTLQEDDSCKKPTIAKNHYPRNNQLKFGKLLINQDITPMDKTRQIIHLDLDAFYCAVEEQQDPALRGVPFAVGGRPEGRGVVSSCSYAARALGIHSAMPMKQAVHLCPNLIVISPHFPAYQAASQAVMARLRDLTSLVEQISIDEAFLDVTDLPDPVEEIARRLQRGIRDELGLPNSLGVASNKLVAKIATNVGKKAAQKGISPNAITIVPPGKEAEFLAELAVEMLWGVGPKTVQKLRDIEVEKIGELALNSEIELIRLFGKNGYELAQRAKGIDHRPIVTERETKSISQEITFVRDIRDEGQLRQTLQEQSHQIAAQLQKQGITARTVKIKLRWHNFKTLTRQITLSQPTDDGKVISAAANQLFSNVWQRREFVRLLGVGVSGLDTDPKLKDAKQIGLWDVDWEKERKVQDILAEVQEKFGNNLLSRGMPDD
jgi:DNA polymerase-4